jgi:hypothetical protein
MDPKYPFHLGSTCSIRGQNDKRGYQHDMRQDMTSHKCLGLQKPSNDPSSTFGPNVARV